MKRQRSLIATVVFLGLLVQACGTAPAAAPNCVEARRVAGEAVALMMATARDESTKLQQLVREGWQSPHEDLTIIRGVEVGECQAEGQYATVVVLFDVLGRLVAAGRSDSVAFEASPSAERRELRLVDVGGVVKVDDISTLEPQVEPEYAIRILTELANSDPSAREKCLALIAELRRIAGIPGTDPREGTPPHLSRRPAATQCSVFPRASGS